MGKVESEKWKIKMKLIALSIYNNIIAPKLETSEKLMMVTVDNGMIISQELVLLREKDPLRIIDIIFQLKPEILICGRLTKLCEYKLRHSNIKLITWIRGNTERILSLCLNNTFIEGYYDRKSHDSSYPSYTQWILIFGIVKKLPVRQNEF